MRSSVSKLLTGLAAACLICVFALNFSGVVAYGEANDSAIYQCGRVGAPRPLHGDEAILRCASEREVRRTMIAAMTFGAVLLLVVAPFRNKVLRWAVGLILFGLAFIVLSSVSRQNVPLYPAAGLVLIAGGFVAVFRARLEIVMTRHLRQLS